MAFSRQGRTCLICASIRGRKEIRRALEIANTASMSEEELEAQWKRKDFIYLQKGSIDLALKQGMEQGMEKGMRKGIEQGEKRAKVDIAKNLLGLLDVETIRQKTGLTVEEIENLKKGINNGMSLNH